MRFNVSKLMKEPGGSARAYSVDEPLSSAERSIVHVRGSISLLRTDKGVWVSGLLDTERSFTCSRCLESFCSPVRIRIEEEFLPAVDVATGAVIVRDGLKDVGQGMIGKEHTLDLTETVAQYALLSSPMEPVCRPDCAGLCATCGTDINQEACFCDKIQYDARPGPFQQLIWGPKR